MSILSSNKEANIKLVKTLARQSSPDNQILADLTTTQAILESDLLERLPQNRGKGGSDLATKYQNLFGIKPGSLYAKGTIGVIKLQTTEYIHGLPEKQYQPFLYNKTIEDSIEQHKKLFTSLPRYSKVLAAKTFEEAANAVKAGGYATDPNYVKELEEVYNAYVKDK